MLVLPAMSEAPVRVPLFMTGLLRVLLLRVSVAVCVTIVPDAGNIAEDLTPVPPFAGPKTPVTAADWSRLSAPKVGVPPLLGTAKTW